ncbi:MAG: acyltransferase [Nevskia sp.]|nr:acyltransferase [Nevskia sp.]
MRNGKLIQLEAGRGIAALVVVVGHFLYGLDPQGTLLGFIPMPAGFYLLNGKGAVTFFFVLSGFVLTFRLFNNPDWAEIANASIKRYFRLTPAIAVSVLLSWLLFHFDLYHYRPVGALTRHWTATNGGVYEGLAAPTFGTAAYDAFFGVYRGWSLFNSALWTMRIELLGSYLSFALAGILIYGARARWLVVAGVAALCAVYAPAYCAFVAGTALAYRVSRSGAPRLGPWTTLALLVLGFWVHCYEPPEGPGRFVPLPAEHATYFLHTLSALCFMLVLLGNATAARRLGGRVGYFLGRISFPAYLVHLPIVFSLSCWLYLAKVPLLLNLAGTVALVLVVSWYASSLDNAWVRIVNRVSRRFGLPALLKSRSAARGAEAAS